MKVILLMDSKLIEGKDWKLRTTFRFLREAETKLAPATSLSLAPSAPKG